MNIGPDMICKKQDRLIIYAKNPMDWPLREFHRVPIKFEDQTYYLRTKSKAQPPHAMVYELWPWPADHQADSSKQINYTEAYVMERDRIATTDRAHGNLHTILLPLFPFLGLCWSRFKNTTLTDLGFDPVSTTKASIALIFYLFLLQGVFVEWFGTGIIGNRHLDTLILLLLGLDTLLRFDRMLRFDKSPWGFCEWLWPKKSK